MGDTEVQIQGSSELRILIVAIGYYPIVIPSDKQFITDLVSSLPEDVAVAVWTINEAVPQDSLVLLGRRQVRYVNINRLLHKPIPGGESGLNQHPAHNGVRNYFEIFLSLLFNVPTSIRKLVREFKPHVIHLADNPGPIVWMLRSIAPGVTMTCSRPTTWAGTFPKQWFYNLLLKITFGPAFKVVAFTNACKRSLLKAGLDDNKVQVIPWGVADDAEETGKFPLCRAARTLEESHPRLLVAVDDRCVREGNLTQWVKWATAFSQRAPVTFTFCIRNSHFLTAYFSVASEYVHIIKSSPAEFYAVLAQSDILVSSGSSSNRTTLPPLAWIAALQRGLPVVAVYSPGLEDLLQGDCGFYFRRNEELEDGLVRIHQNRDLLRRMATSAHAVAQKQFRWESICLQYLKMWQDAASSRGNNQ